MRLAAVRLLAKLASKSMFIAKMKWWLLSMIWRYGPSAHVFGPRMPFCSPFLRLLFDRVKEFLYFMTVQGVLCRGRNNWGAKIHYDSHHALQSRNRMRLHPWDRANVYLERIVMLQGYERRQKSQVGYIPAHDLPWRFCYTQVCWLDYQAISMVVCWSPTTNVSSH